MEATKNKNSKAVVFFAGGDQALAQAITEGVMNNKLARCTEELRKQNEVLQNKVDFWRSMNRMHNQQIFENSMKRIRDAEIRTSWEYINPKTCLFFGFVAGVLFEVLLTTLVMV